MRDAFPKNALVDYQLLMNVKEILWTQTREGGLLENLEYSERQQLLELVYVMNAKKQALIEKFTNL